MRSSASSRPSDGASTWSSPTKPGLPRRCWIAMRSNTKNHSRSAPCPSTVKWSAAHFGRARLRGTTASGSRTRSGRSCRGACWVTCRARFSISPRRSSPTCRATESFPRYVSDRLTGEVALVLDRPRAKLVTFAANGESRPSIVASLGGYTGHHEFMWSISCYVDGRALTADDSHELECPTQPGDTGLDCRIGHQLGLADPGISPPAAGVQPVSRRSHMSDFCQRLAFPAPPGLPDRPGLRAPPALPDPPGPRDVC